ncbi:MAG: hypothetical protein ABEK17_04410 [Candidatus Aenigmatarchaeota archaeon]
MGTCQLCGNDGSLLKANHKEMGTIKICRDCWKDMYNKNNMVSGNGGSGGSVSSCPTCGV